VGVQADEVSVLNFISVRKGLRWSSPFFLLLFSWLLADAALAFEPVGEKTVRLHAKDGSAVVIAKVQFAPAEQGRVKFKLVIDHTPMRDYFLSMREFKCLEGQGEIFCHVPYPYPQPGTVARGDWAWLEHSLMFMFKKPSEFGAKLWNGIYFELRETPQGLEGAPQAVDLNLIGAPPERSDVPPFRKAMRDDVPVGARWFGKLTIN
jgi:hypothetical protein